MNEVLNLPQDINAAIAERNMESSVVRVILDSMPKQSLEFLETPIVQRMLRVNLLNGFLAGSGIDIENPQPRLSAEEVARLEAERLEAEKLVREADEKARSKETSNVRQLPRKAPARKRGGK